MPVSGWIRKWRGAHVDQNDHLNACAFMRAATRVESLDQVLDLGVQGLLATAAGDRAGLWLSAGRNGETSQGRVIEARPGPIPEQWKHLDISTPFLRSAVESQSALRVELGTGPAMSHLGPLAGMHSGIWIPLRVWNRTFGLALVAYRRAGAKPNMEALRARADEIVLAIGHHHATRRASLAGEELQALSSLSRAILCGVSAESILPQIARAARHYLQAEFVTLGGGNAPSPMAEAWNGPDDWRALLQQEPLRQLWRKAFEEGRESAIAGDAMRDRIGSSPENSRAMLDRVVAIPIEARSRNLGVLMAGFQASEDSSEYTARLDSYSLLAAMALDRELGQEERAACNRSLRQMIEDSGECLVAVNERGIVREASRTAVNLLFPDWAPREEMLLEDFFAPAARQKVAQWRKQIVSQDSALAFELDDIAAAPEAPLHRGANVRLHYRSMISSLGSRHGDGTGDGHAMWLVHLENQDERRMLRESEGRLEAEIAGLMDAIESGILLLDASGNIRMVSDRLAAIMGCHARRLYELGTINALMDRLASQFARPAETVARWREHVRRGDEANWDEFELIEPSRKIVERSARPIVKPDGTRVGRLEVYRDITGQRLIQSKLLQTEKMAALGQLVSGIAHELNNPLTSIQGYAQLLLSRRSASGRAGDAQRISQEAERAGRIVKNLLLFSRETKPERTPVNLNDVIERTLPLRAYELKLENIAVELVLDRGIAHTLADAAQLQQVILNLIVNAEQAILQDRGEESRRGRILLRTRRLAGDRIGLEVSDDGPGVAPENASRIFDPFFTTKAAGVGTGLGLSIVYGIVREHGGEVNMESQPGQGATLTIELPGLSMAAFDFSAENAAITPRTSAVAPILPPVRRAMRAEPILVVEDEPTVAELIADVMAEEGYRVDILLDSREALGRLEVKHYGLVICDLKMPNLDGPGLYRALLGRETPLQQKLLFVTGDTMSPRTLEFLKSSGLPYLAKPFLVDELKEAVRLAIAAAPVGEAVADGPASVSTVARRK